MGTTSTPDRVPEAAVDPRFVQRWSPRAFQEQAVPAADLASLFEAARWSPSCFNEQPWHFVYGARPAESDHARVYELLVETNQVWAGRAPVLGIVFAKRTFTANGKANRWAGFDAGMASMALTLQAQELGLSVHFMGGFHADRAATTLGLDGEIWEPMAAFAVGYRGDKSVLPEALQAREQPSPRKAPAEVARTVGSAAPAGGAALTEDAR